VEPTLVSEPPLQAPGQAGLLTRRNFLRLAAVSAAGLAVYAGEFERHALEVSPVTITIPRLPAAFAGMKIVQVSDIHFEEYTEAFFLETVVRRVNALQPELVVLTGDFVSSKPLPRRWDAGLAYHCAEVLSGIECPLRYAILGNHDVKAGASAVIHALETHKIPLLADQSIPLDRNGERVWLAGMRDALEQRPDIQALLPGQRRSEREPLILLAHEPDFADHLLLAKPDARIDLILSGHTHGGQVRFPLLPPLLLPPLGKKYVHGLFQLAGGTQLYVNRGVGTVGLPFRLDCPPEITWITLA
jgi:uncharacterized protein